jgi:hypothetical protein
LRFICTYSQSKVFCSAGLVLPDAGARQINIGGWSGDSTYGKARLPYLQRHILTILIGVRFYTPDGAPGVNSTNQWQENYNEVRLQKGRWYPSAMTMYVLLTSAHPTY